MRGLVVTATFAVGLITMAGPVAAQQAGAPLTLDEAMSIARVENPAVQQAANQLALNEPERWNFLLGELLPNVGVSLLTTGYNGNLQRRSTDNFGNPIESPSADWVYYSNTSQSLDLNWSVQGYSLFNALDRRDHTLTGRDLSVDAARWTLRAQVQRQFFDAQQQLALLDVEEALLEGRRIDLESATLLFEEAGESQVDVFDAEVQLQQQQIAIERQRSVYEQALLTLRQTLGGGEVPGIVEAELPVFDPSVLDREQLVETALDMSPDVLTARADVSGARLAVRESDETWWPTLQLRYSFFRRAQDTETSALFDLSPVEQDYGSNFYIGLSFPAFNDFFAMREQQAGARIQLANQEISLDQQQLQIEAEVRSNFVALQNEWRALQIAERSAELAERSTGLAREEYRLGIRTFEQLQQTVESEATARRQALTSRYAFVDALIALEESVGVPVRPAGAPGAAN